VAIEVLRQTGPLGVSSANRTGSSPATTADDARAQLGDRVAVYLDGGATPAAVASTIVDLTTPDGPLILREGAVSVDALREVLPTVRTRAE
jgi:tRNA A37 threonylcarbamoyladenosine synthetase subunit TsaC/SUA5/YrdC